MASFQGSDWFKSGSHVKVTEAESKRQLVHQASQQIAESSRRLQVAYDDGLALFSSNFRGTDVQIQEAQETLSAILAVSQSLQELHKRLASSIMTSTSDSALVFVSEDAVHIPEVLAQLKSKERQLQIQVDKCTELRAENVLLQKKLQALTAPNSCRTSQQSSNRWGSGDQLSSIPAGPIVSQWSASDMDRPNSPRPNSPLVFNGVLSLAHAGTWLQMLRSKLSPGASDRRRSDFADVLDTRDGTASEDIECEDEPNSFSYPLPLRRSRSEGACDRLRRSTVYRRGSELSRTSSAGCPPEKCGLHADSLTADKERDRRRRTHVVMEDAADADQTSTVHFLTPELAARSALFRG